MAVRQIRKMKEILNKFSLRFIILFILIVSYSFTIIFIDNFFKQEVSLIQSEFQSTTSYQSADSLLSECNDDLQGFGISPLFNFEIFNREEYISISPNQDFFLLQKIPSKLLSIPPPSIYYN